MNTINSIGTGPIRLGDTQPAAAKGPAVQLAGPGAAATPGAPAHPAGTGSAKAFFGKTEGLRGFEAATLGNVRSGVAQIVAFKLETGMQKMVDRSAVDGANAAKAIASLFS